MEAVANKKDLGMPLSEANLVESGDRRYSIALSSL